MNRIVCLSLILSLCGFAASAQKNQLTGSVADSSSKELMEMATVTVQDNKDSSLLTYTLTDKKGGFKLTGLPADKTLRLLISYTGYRTFVRILPPGHPADLGKIFLAPSAHELNTVVIEGDRPPIAIRKDTIEFNASAFKTRTNAMVEDLLKKLPGVDIDDEGNITVNGKKVTRVLVEGREFFGNDPKLATKNLPAAIVDKVQVMDTKTRQEAKLGVEKDGEDRTLNVTLKADKKKGLFGRVSAGGGTDDRFELAGMVSGFDGPRQLSVLASSNNLNKIGFSQGEMGAVAEKKAGGMSISISDNGAFSMNGISFGSGGDGIRTATMAGYNYNDQWNKKHNVNNSYFFNNTDSRYRTLRNTQYNDGRQTRSNREGTGRNANHRLNFGLETQLDSVTMLSFNPSFDYAETSTRANGLDTTWSDGSLLNHNTTRNRNSSTRTNFSSNLNISRQLKKKGRSIALGFSNNNSNQDGYAFNYSERGFYENGIADSSAITDQRNTSTNTNENYEVVLKYTEPISKTWRVTAGYGFQYSQSRSDRQTYNYDEVEKGYTDLDPLYTNKFRTVFTSQNPQLSFNHSGKAWTANIGGSVYLNVLDNYSYTTRTGFRQYQTNIAPSSRLAYRNKKNGNWYLSYFGNMQQPSIDQLQPLKDNSNTLNERIGNPDLKPAFTQRISFGFNQFSPTGIGVFSSIGYSPTMNRITTVIKARPDGSQQTRFVNTNGFYNLNANATLSKSKKAKDYQWRAMLFLNAYGGRNINFSNINNPKGDTTIRRIETFSMNFSVGAHGTYAYKELLEFTLNYRPSFFVTKYPQGVTTQGNYIQHRATLGSTVYWPRNFAWENDINYVYNTRITPGFRKGVAMWHMGLEYSFLKSKRAQVKIYAYDLLKQSTSVRRNVSEFSIDDVQTEIVDQYYMLTLTYNISVFGAKAKTGNRRVDGGRFFIF